MKQDAEAWSQMCRLVSRRLQWPSSEWKTKWKPRQSKPPSSKTKRMNRRRISNCTSNAPSKSNKSSASSKVRPCDSETYFKSSSTSRRVLAHSLQIPKWERKLSAWQRSYQTGFVSYKWTSKPTSKYRKTTCSSTKFHRWSRTISARISHNHRSQPICRRHRSRITATTSRKSIGSDLTLSRLAWNSM